MGPWRTSLALLVVPVVALVSGGLAFPARLVAAQPPFPLT